MKLLPLLIVPALASSQAFASPVEAVRQIFTNPKGMAAPGCAVGAFRGGKTMFVTAAGAADIEAGKPLNADTLFYAASLSKQFTSLAAGVLVNRGKISLKDDVRKFIPELPQYEVPVTIEMLMHHTSGIRDSLALVHLAGAEPREIDKKTALRLLFSQNNTNFTPGTDWSYSNGGYLLLAEVVERVSGMPFAEFARRSILKPLGMNRSFFMNDADPGGGNIARGYAAVGDGFEIRDTYPRFSGSGGLMISMNDLARFDRDIEVGHKVWKPSIQKIVLSPGVFTNGDIAKEKRSTLGYGGGLEIGRRDGQHVVQHSGVSDGFGNMYVRLPERRLGVALLCNSGGWNPRRKSDAVIEAIEGDIFVADPSTKRTSLAGRFRSEELQATYDISLEGEVLNAVISSPVATRTSPLRFQRNYDGSYSAQGVTLFLDADAQGFVVRINRGGEIRFNRVN